MERSFFRRLTPLGLMLALLTTGQESAFAQPVEVTNLAQAVGVVAVSGDFVAFSVLESDTDLNGDGDTDDAVVHVYDSTSGTITNVGLQAESALAFRDDVLAFTVKESAHGNVDLNGDGDTLDEVLHVYNTRTGITTNTLLPTGSSAAVFFLPVEHGGRLMAFTVLESFHGNTDLNGDGDALDAVAHVLDTRSGNITNVGLCTLLEKVAGTSVALLVRESCEANTDLNGDGDTFDQVLHVYDGETGIITNFGVAISSSPELQVTDTLIVFSIVESSVDLNGDGDTFDSVLQIFDIRANSTSILGVALSTSRFFVSGSLVTFTVSEDSQGGTDLNSDGDASDLVVHVYDARSATLTNLGLAGSSGVSPHFVGIAVSEFAQGDGDLNGDGDLSDRVAHIYDANLDVTRNLGFALGDPNDPPAVGLNFAGFTVSEAGQGNTDLNGDGDVDDRIAHIYDPVSGHVTNLGLFVFRSLRLSEIDGDSFLFGVNEFFEGTDLNGDGDISIFDNVLHVHDATREVTSNLQVVFSGSEVQTQTGHLIAIKVPESSQGNTDLNGDGDSSDVILHVAGSSCGAGTVNSGVGSVVEVVRLNGKTGIVTASIGDAIEATFDAAPMGPAPASYILWVWASRPASPLTLVGAGESLGCTVNPTPFHGGRNPQPFMCLRSPSLPGLVCQGVTEIPGPIRAPWSRTRSTGLGQPQTLTIQGLIQDNGSANSTGYSVTNAVVLDVR